MFDTLYHNRVLELAANIPFAERLDQPDGSAKNVSRLCGSAMTVDIALDQDRRIAAIGFDPRACALGQAVTSVLARNAVGKSRDDIRTGRDALRDMLEGRCGPPSDGDFQELRHFEGVRHYPQRHPSCMLAFETCLDAFADAGLP